MNPFLTRLVLAILLAFSSRISIAQAKPAGNSPSSSARPGASEDQKPKSADDSKSAEPHVWKDPATGLSWAAPAFDERVSWDEAKKYCKNLKTAGHHWRLPTIDELAGIYDPSQSVPCGATKGAAPDPCHIKSGIKLMQWQAWSGTHDPKHSGSAYFFNFIDGQRRALPYLNAYGLQSLCVAK